MNSRVVDLVVVPPPSACPGVVADWPVAVTPWPAPWACPVRPAPPGRACAASWLAAPNCPRPPACCPPRIDPRPPAAPPAVVDWRNHGWLPWLAGLTTLALSALMRMVAISSDRAYRGRKI